MKIVFSLWMGLVSLVAAAQTGQQEIATYSAERVMKYRTKIGLNSDQADFIRKLYNKNSVEFNNLKWDLDEANLQLSELLDHPKVDSDAAMQLMEKVMALESEIKKQRLSVFLSIKNQLTEEQQQKLADLNDDDQIQEIDGKVQLKVKNKYNSDEEPLYIIVDGVETKRVKKLKNVDPKNIKSVEVLKGESARDRYGEDGKNGVIIIKVKQ